jgi:hypothetical protein
MHPPAAKPESPQQSPAQSYVAKIVRNQAGNARVVSNLHERTHVSHPSINTVNILPRPNRRTGNIPSQNDGYDEPVNTDNSRHDYRDDVFHYTSGVTDSGVEEGDAGFPCSPLEIVN